MKMKPFIRISALLLVMVLTAPAHSQNSVQVIRARQANQFAFKAPREMVKAQVEVLAENGNRIDSQQLMKRKMVIDFTALPKGNYTIVVKKDGKAESFAYKRN